MGAFKHISSAQSLHAETTDFSSSSEQMSRYTVIEAPGPVNDCLPPTATNLPDNPTPVDDMPLSEGELMASVLGDDDPRLHEKRDHWRSLAEECRHADNADGQTPDRKIALSRHKLPPPIALPKSAREEPEPKPEPEPITIEPVEPFNPDTIQPDSPDDWDNEPFEAPEAPNNPWDDEPPEMANRPVYGSSPATLANNTDSQNAGNSIPLVNAGVTTGTTSSHSELVTLSRPLKTRRGTAGSQPHKSESSKKKASHYMSFQAMAEAVTIHRENPLHKFVFLMLANYCDENNQCYPSNKRLAADCCISERSVQRAISAMEYDGLVSVAERETESGRTTSNLYTIHPERAKKIVHPSKKLIEHPPRKPSKTGGDSVTPSQNTATAPIPREGDSVTPPPRQRVTPPPRQRVTP